MRRYSSDLTQLLWRRHMQTYFTKLFCSSLTCEHAITSQRHHHFNILSEPHTLISAALSACVCVCGQLPVSDVTHSWLLKIITQRFAPPGGTERSVCVRRGEPSSLCHCEHAYLLLCCSLCYCVLLYVVCVYLS